MKKIFIPLFLLVLTANLSFSQTEQKTYYDENWESCDASSAHYYRIITLDENQMPLSIVKYYYITGELQFEGNMSYIDLEDEDNSILDGKATWYYKSGLKFKESNFVDGKEHGLSVYWYPSGVVANEMEYANGLLHGLWIEYYESGTPKTIASYQNGEIVRPFITTCNKLGDCELVFYDGFKNSENKNGWNLTTSDDDFASRIRPEEGLEIVSKSGRSSFRQTLEIPIDYNNDFSIETAVHFEDGYRRSRHGIIWGFEDWDNYSYFVISATGYYSIGSYDEGINFKLVSSDRSYSINLGKEKNELRIVKSGEKIFYSINSSLVYSGDFFAQTGDQTGFWVGTYDSEKEKTVLFEYLDVRQKIFLNLPDNGSPSNTTDTEWLGNGSGFFIDKSGYIATNYHVVKDAKYMEIEFVRNGKKKRHKVVVVRSDPENDLAIVKIEDEDFVPFDYIPYYFSEKLADIGTSVFALGYPMALAEMGTDIKFTDGKISAQTGYKGEVTTYQTTTPIQGGNSGGPLFDFEGNLIAINSSGLDYAFAENVAYSIKSSYLKSLVEVLDDKIVLPKNKSLASKSLTEKIKVLSGYVVLIKIK